MATEWIQSITDRDYGDIQLVQYDPSLENAKGVYNASDLNRIENNTQYCMEYMLEHKIIRSAPALRIKTNWNENDIVVASEMYRIIENVDILCGLSNPIIQDDLPKLYKASQMNYYLANQIEECLEIMHTQPELPINYFILEIENGMILSITDEKGVVREIKANKAEIAENEIANIVGTPYGEDAQYQHFTTWSGDADDIQYIDTLTNQNTTFIGQYRDVKLTANFKTVFPRTLTLTDAYISLSGQRVEDGPRQGVYYAGDQVMIIADRAADSKAFYNWEGTEEALDAISFSEKDPSTVWLTMPDKDVQLKPKYINAGPHYIKIMRDNAVISEEWYDYNAPASIYASVPDHYGFDSWSGDTKYLTDIYSESQSFDMPDLHLTFRINYSYRYSYNDVTVINGKIQNGDEQVNKVQSVKQTSSLTLVPTPPNENQGLEYWSVEHYGYINTDSLGNHTNTFVVGDGNGIVTGHYNDYKTVSIYNVNNSGNTTEQRIVKNRKYKVSTTSSTGHYKFNGWYVNNTRVSTNYEYTFTVTDDMTIEARYDYYEYHTVTLINRNNGGQTTTSQVLHGNYWSSSTTEDVGDYLFVRWLKNGTSDSTNYNSYGFYVYNDVTIEVEYRPKETYTLSVVNGHIQNGGSSGQFKERQAITIVADSPAEGASFTGWSTASGSVYSLGSSTTATVKLGRGNATVQANYKNIRKITIVTNSGTNTYNVVQGNSIYINALPAPNTWEWDTATGWTIDDGGSGSFSNRLRSDTYYYAGETDTTIRANYKAIPYFNITVENGYVMKDGEWVTSGVFLRNSAPKIQMHPAPQGYQFLQWEVLLGVDNDVAKPLAETTNINNLLHDVVVRATYYIPAEEQKYTLTITQQDGTIETYNNTVGTQVDISAQEPLEGMKFVRWDKDYQYLTRGRYVSNNVVNMPPRDITLEPVYKPLDWTEKFHIYMHTSELLLSVDEEGNETWASDGEFEEGTVVKIRTKDIPFICRFDGWSGETPEQTAIIKELDKEETEIIVNNFDAYITANIVNKISYVMQITNGETSGEYVEDADVDIYFTMDNTDDIHYKFIRWTGPGLAYLKNFDIFEPGDFNHPQSIKMPPKRIEITAEYEKLYHLKLENGTIDDELEEPYFAEGTEINITANDGYEGMKFIRWVGDIAFLKNPYDPTTTVTMSNGPLNIKATYTMDDNQNNIGFTLTNIEESNIINIEDIEIISGKLGIGFIITDSKGHIYTITNLNTETASIVRLTKIVKGGNVYE